MDATLSLVSLLESLVPSYFHPGGNQLISQQANQRDNCHGSTDGWVPL